MRTRFLRFSQPVRFKRRLITLWGSATRNLFVSPQLALARSQDYQIKPRHSLAVHWGTGPFDRLRITTPMFQKSPRPSWRKSGRRPWAGFASGSGLADGPRSDVF